jgi:hypothetical protein
MCRDRYQWLLKKTLTAKLNTEGIVKNQERMGHYMIVSEIEHGSNSLNYYMEDQATIKSTGTMLLAFVQRIECRS